eukprot:1161373-Pelagomonas_calceolata.AAC.5
MAQCLCPSAPGKRQQAYRAEAEGCSVPAPECPHHRCSAALRPPAAAGYTEQGSQAAAAAAAAAAASGFDAAARAACCCWRARCQCNGAAGAGSRGGGWVGVAAV